MSGRLGALLKRKANAALPAISDKGQGLIEYALILMLVAIIVFVVLVVFGNSVGNLYSVAVNAI